MRRALELAARGGRDVRPNPQVGCVIVGPSGEVLGAGWHQHFGGPHAEVVALQDLEGVDLSAATLFVNLEPCSYHGKTPPCADLLVARGIGSVVVGTLDPNPRVAGRGVEHLRSNGIQVTTGVLEDDARILNAGFFRRMRAGRPYVRLKMAQSLDGRAAPAKGSSRWITCEASRRRVHQMRADADAILTGTGTVLADDPSLTVRHVRGESPLRLVLDRRGVIPPTARVLTDGHATEIIRGPDTGTEIDLAAALAAIRPEVLYLMVEAGPRLSSAMIQAGLVDELWVFTAPVVLGSGRASFEDPARETLEDALRGMTVHYEQVGVDMLTRITLQTP
ncbi:MAG: bifunctional diaminohydroxyphosphoribosylaminopyrimidine deaminase/5-amino-6-(5-phosphoribosylamino)uracil reductase RibD [Rhodothermales bacterium]|nr:bifunctional diaminohydroxyphosphoribosylaminopyrimidine deaminase/5-amino-6-(5-phosphoribosylamino)uracil reductase RibD [Rhodothermales bacterium]